MRKYTHEDQDRIEDALRVLAAELCVDVGVCGAAVKICENGDVSADILVDKGGSAFRVEISEDGDSVLRKHYMVPGPADGGCGGHG